MLLGLEPFTLKSKSRLMRITRTSTTAPANRPGGNVGPSDANRNNTVDNRNNSNSNNKSDDNDSNRTHNHSSANINNNDNKTNAPGQSRPGAGGRREIQTPGARGGYIYIYIERERDR